MIEVSLLTAEEVEAALAAAGSEVAALEADQRDLLRLPLNLALLAAVPSAEDSLAFATTRDLLAQYWKTKRRAAFDRRPRVRFERVIDVLVEAMSTRQTLAVPDLVLEAEGLDDDFDVLASENVVVRTERSLSRFSRGALRLRICPPLGRYWTDRA